MTAFIPIQLPSPDFKRFTRSSETSIFETLEKMAGQFDNKVPIAWFELGQRVSRSVARIITPTGLGTGWLINGGYVLTNSHVIESAVVAESSRIQFDFENDIDGSPLTPKTFDIDEFLVTVPSLDYTIVKPSGNPEQEFGFLDISKALPPKSGDVNTQFPVVIQHPGGRRKEFSGFENELSHTDGSFVWYTSDTEPGSSGSPVLGGTDFKPFALHHAGGPHNIGGQTKILNEGILLSAILNDLVRNHPAIASEIGIQSEESLLNDAAVLWLSRGRVANFVAAVVKGDQEVGNIELTKLGNSFHSVGGFEDVVALQDAMNRLEATRDKEIVPVIVAAAGVSAGAAAAHWAHITRNESLPSGSVFSPLGPTSFTLDLESFSIGGGGSVFTPLGGGNFGVGVTVERFGIGGGVSVATPIGGASGGFKIQFENASNIERLYRGVHGLFDLTDASQSSYFASIQPTTEALPVLAGVFLAGVASGASAYRAGK